MYPSWSFISSLSCTGGPISTTPNCRVVTRPLRSCWLYFRMGCQVVGKTKIAPVHNPEYFSIRAAPVTYCFHGNYLKGSTSPKYVTRNATLGYLGILGIFYV